MTPRVIRHLFLASVFAACMVPSSAAEEQSQRDAGRQRASARTRKAAITHEYAEVNGVRLHYAKAGNGKKLILFVHGFPEFWYEYKKQLEEFGNTYTAVAPDMRGYNLSSKPKELEKYQVSYMVEDLRQLAEKLGHKKFILVAHDWGGAIAWAFALAHPERLEKLVIINAPHPAVFQRELASNPEQQKASQYMLMFRSPQAESLLSANNYEALVQAVLADGLKTGVFTEEDKKAYIEAWSQPGALTGGLNYYRAANAGPPAAGETRASAPAPGPDAFIVKVPTLVIWGEKDTALLTSSLDGLDAFVPRLTIKRIPDGTHWVIHERPDLVNRYIREFIE
jgi:pimeloyl-ACP methyl ester carboxylesterase